MSMLDYDEDGNVDQTTIIPMVDGGTEGFYDLKLVNKVFIYKIVCSFEHEDVVQSFHIAMEEDLVDIADQLVAFELCE